MKIFLILPQKEDSTELLQSKCEQLAEAIRESNYTVVYTGAGISTVSSTVDNRCVNNIVNKTVFLNSL